MNSTVLKSELNKMEKTYATLTNVVEEEYSAQVEITLHQASLYTLSIVEKLMQKF